MTRYSGISCFAKTLAILIVGGILIYVAFFYNPPRVISQKQLASALSKGLLEDCHLMIQRTDQSWTPSKSEWPDSIRTFRPRSVFVSSSDGGAVRMTLWRNHREWQFKIFGLIIDLGKGEQRIDLVVYSDTYRPFSPERWNDNPSSWSYYRRLHDTVYLRYPKRMKTIIDPILDRTLTEPETGGDS